jgi:ATP/maltotriose-dependent transcriptional regulator MalT
LAAALWRFWSVRGQFIEGQHWLETALARADGVPASRRAMALFGAAQILARRGDLEAAWLRCDEALGYFHQLSDAARVAACLNTLGNIAFDRSDYEQADAFYEQSLALQRDLGDRRGIAVALCNLGSVAYCRGDYAAAERHYAENLILRREIRDAAGTARGLIHLAYAARAGGQYARASTLVREGLRGCLELADRWSYAECLELLAEVAEVHSEPERACTLLGSTEALRESMAVPLPPAERAAHARVVDALRARLTPECFVARWQAGRQMPLERAIDYALEPPTQVLVDVANVTELHVSRAADESSPLTVREYEIAALIARGASNRDIAQELVIAEGTAARHVANILRKLTFNSRAQIAAWYSLNRDRGAASA